MRKWSLDDQEWHLTLGVPTSEWPTPEGRERELAQNNNMVKTK
jgi:hypothetical protein